MSDAAGCVEVEIDLAAGFELQSRDWRPLNDRQVLAAGRLGAKVPSRGGKEVLRKRLCYR
jgi:hypothetical protein